MSGAVLADFYEHPVPGFIFTGVLILLLAGYAVWVAIRTFGPGARPPDV